MTYRQLKKYTKQIFAPWGYDDITFTKEFKKEALQVAKQFKSKRHLQRYYEREY